MTAPTCVATLTGTLRPDAEGEILGRRAFDAYRARLLPLVALPQWEHITPIQQVAWADAARAAREDR